MNKIIYRNSFKKYLSFILLVIFLLNTNSCKKDTSALNAKNDVFYANQLTAQSKVSASDVNGWFTKYQQLKPAAELLAQAQQAVINGSSVVRVPMGTNSAFYFIKVDGVLQVYIYKWLNQSPGTMQFTGRIVSYSFQDNEVRELDYKARQLTQVQNLAHILPNISPDGIKPNSVTLGYIWGAFTCWLGGGSWVYVASEIKATDFDSPKRVDSTQYDYYECNHGSTTTGDNSNWDSTNWGLDWLNTGASHFVASADYGGGLYWIQPPSSPCGGIQQESTDYPVPSSSKPKVQSTADKTTASTGDCGNGNTVFIPITLIDQSGSNNSQSVINEPEGYATVTDLATGASYYYSDLKNDFVNYPQIMDQIDSDNESMAFPTPVMSMAGVLLSQSYFKEITITKVAHPEWSKTQVYSVALWNTIGGTTHFILDVAGFVPVIGEAASLINGGIYFIEGDKINCALSLVSAIPVAGWVSIAGKWIQVASTSVPVIEAAGKIAYRAVQVGKEIRLIKVAINIFDYASVLALKAIQPADQTLTNISRYLIDNYGMRIAPSETTLKNIIDDIIQAGDATGSKTEQLSDALLQREGYVKQASQYGSNNGFDGVYIKGDPNNPTDIIINEAKQMASGGNIKLNPAGGKAAQMSDAWIDQTMDAMRNYSTDTNIQNLGNVLFSNQAIITKTLTAVDKTTGEIVILKLAKY